jgi:hypothetical protein
MGEHILNELRESVDVTASSAWVVSCTHKMFMKLITDVNVIKPFTHFLHYYQRISL